MISAIVSRLIILLFGTLYPAYASYKAVRTKNVKEYVKWMMYWIVFAFFTCAETFTDVFLSFWFPFYYEIKVVLVLWLLSPATRGSSLLYRNFVHPTLSKKEEDIDQYISKAKEQGYHTMLQLGSRGVTYATNVIMQTAIKGGGGIVNQLRRSYSLSDLSNDPDFKSDLNRNQTKSDATDSADVPRDPRLWPSRKPTGSHVDLYFPEMDIRSHPHSHSREIPVNLSQIRSSEDISSGYSSAEPLYGECQVVMEEGNPLTRTASVGATRPRVRPMRNQPKKVQNTEGEADDFSADCGWSQTFPPLPLATLFPDLFNQETSQFPPQALLSPEALQLIIAKSIYSGHKPHVIYEVSNKEEVLINSPEISKGNSFQGTEPNSFQAVTESKNNVSNDVFICKSDEVKPLEILNTEIYNENTVDETREKAIDKPNQEENSLDFILPIDTSFKNCYKELEDIGAEEIKATKVKDELSGESSTEHEEIHECFQDASEDDILPAIILSNIGVTIGSENISIQTPNECLKPTPSMESVASSGGDLVFEDSLPDVAVVTGRESPNICDRKGKYNKGKAPPPPPDFKKSFDPESIPTDDGHNAPSSSIISEPDLILESTKPSQRQILGSEFFTGQSIDNVLNIENSPQEKESDYVKSYGRKEASPTPSSQSKKDNSNFSKFLPKSGMGSLFGFWGNRDDNSQGNKSSNIRKSPSNVNTKPVTTEMFYSPPSTSNIEYSPAFDNHEITGSVTPKIRIRQMSHSPSRKKCFDYN